MPREVVTTVYKFEELPTEAAKEKAREWLRASVFEDSHDWEFVYEDAATIAALFGLDIRQRSVKTVGGKTRYAPSIYFSGFWSQGDGACFEGRYEYKADALQAVKDYAPNDENVHAIVEALQSAQKRLKGADGYTLIADCKNTGRGSASHDMDVAFGATDYPESMGVTATCQIQVRAEAAENEVKNQLRAFADWIYRQLESEYDYQASDEAIDESLIANGYEFEASGALA